MENQLSQLQERYTRPFFEIFIISLIICLLPSKAIGFVIPLICVFWFIIRSKSGDTFKALFLLILFWGILLGFYYAFNMQLGMDFNISNGVLSFIHYSALLVMLVFPSAITSRKFGYEKYAKLLIAVILFEGLYGIMQRFLSIVYRGADYGDVVEGTINPLSFLTGHSGFSNQFYAINMVFFLAFCFPLLMAHKKKAIPYLVGLVAILLASVGHVFISFFIAIGIVFLLFEGGNLLLKPKILIGFLVLVSSILFLFATLDSGVFDGASRQFEMFVSGNSPKSKAMGKAMNELGGQVPTLHLVGVGPGQYSSRAGIIASGTYGALSNFFIGLPFLNLGMTENFRQYVLADWTYVSNNTDAFGNSTMYRPFFSMLSVYTEFGGLLFIFLGIWIFFQVIKLRKIYFQFKKAGNRQLQLIAFCCATSILFLVFIGLYENYYETPQGIFNGVLLILIMRSILTNVVPFADQDNEAQVLMKTKNA